MSDSAPMQKSDLSDSQRGWRILGGIGAVIAVVILLLWSPWSSPPTNIEEANAVWDKWVSSKQEQACADFYASTAMEEYLNIWMAELTVNGGYAPVARQVFRERC